MNCVICNDAAKDVSYITDGKIDFLICKDCEDRILENKKLLAHERCFISDYKYIENELDRANDMLMSLYKNGDTNIEVTRISHGGAFGNFHEKTLKQKMRMVFALIEFLMKRKKRMIQEFNEMILENMDELLLFILDNSIELEKAKKKGVFTQKAISVMTGLNIPKIKKILDHNNIDLSYENYCEILKCISRDRYKPYPLIS